MIRPVTLLTMATAMVSGAYLFAVKHRAQLLDNQLAAVTQASRLDQQRIRVLQAQWALEIDPNRLQSLASQFSQLQPMKAAQLTTLAALPGLLPPAGSAAPGENPAAPALPLVAANDATPPSPDAAQLAMLPMPPPEAPAAAPVLAPPMPGPAPGVPSPAALQAMLSGKAPAARDNRVAAAARRRSASHVAHSEWAENLPPPRPLYTQPTAETAPMGARVMTVSASPASAMGPSGTQGGSLLGMATDMPPPLPVSQGSGN